MLSCEMAEYRNGILREVVHATASDNDDDGKQDISMADVVRMLHRMDQKLDRVLLPMDQRGESECNDGSTGINGINDTDGDVQGMIETTLDGEEVDVTSSVAGALDETSGKPPKKKKRKQNKKKRGGDIEKSAVGTSSTINKCKFPGMVAVTLVLIATLFTIALGKTGDGGENENVKKAKSSPSVRRAVNDKSIRGVREHDISQHESHPRLINIEEEEEEAQKQLRSTYDCMDLAIAKLVPPQVKQDVDSCCQEQRETLSYIEASCECSVKLVCLGGDRHKCREYAEHCCEEDDNECKCDYLTQACYVSLRTESEQASEYCGFAQEHCCMNDTDSIGGCKCEFWEPILNEKPGQREDIDVSIWNTVEDSCCGRIEVVGNLFGFGDETVWDNPHCKCDLNTYLSLEHEMFTACTLARVGDDGNDSFGYDDRIILERIYNKTGGIFWFNNTGWLSELVEHCEWYGITCDDEGYVTEIIMRHSNVTGKFPGEQLSHLNKLKTLDLAENNLSGLMAGYGSWGYWDTEQEQRVETELTDYSAFFGLRDLTYVDLSQNNLSGRIDVLFAPALEYANFSHNNFTLFTRFKRFKRSHETIRTFDLSYNSIQQQASDIMKNMPPNIEQFILLGNMIQGAPPSLENLNEMRRFDLGSNSLDGTLPDFSTAYPNLQELNLSNQKQGGGSGLSGSISARLSNLPFLATLDLAGNDLTGLIPAAFGNFGQLKLLNLSHNVLTKTIPTELGRLAGTLEVFDVSVNDLSGQIPSEIGRFENSKVLISGNDKISNPAPLSLCSFSTDQFDLSGNTNLCPSERQALKKFYDTTKGKDWTERTNWLHEYKDHCVGDWYGVTCRDGAVTELILENNYLSGWLTSHIGELRSLEILDLSDNVIKRSIPAEIGSLTNLTHLRLSYNAFTGTLSNELLNLTQLQLVHLHGNRLTGIIPELNVTPKDISLSESSFASDCGEPSAFEDPVQCEGCTMCCNSQEDCQPNVKDPIQQEFGTYVEFTWVYFVGIVGVSGLMALALRLYNWYKKRSKTSSSIRSQAAIARDIDHALDIIGKESVYQFFLSNSWLGWFITLSTMAVQLWMLFFFVRGAEPNASDEKTDLVFTWKCPRDTPECDDQNDLDWEGWTVFAILMFIHLSSALISGFKLIMLSTKSGHKLHRRLRYFIGGMLLNVVTLFTLFASILYNQAIASTNTEIIANSVIILFITDADEYLYSILIACNQDWAERIIQQSTEDVSSGGNVDNPEVSENVDNPEASENKLQRIESELEKVQNELKLMRGMLGVEAASTVPQDEIDDSRRGSF